MFIHSISLGSVVFLIYTCAPDTLTITCSYISQTMLTLQFAYVISLFRRFGMQVFAALLLETPWSQVPIRFVVGLALNIYYDDDDDEGCRT